MMGFALELATGGKYRRKIELQMRRASAELQSAWTGLDFSAAEWNFSANACTLHLVARWPVLTRLRLLFV